MLTLLLAESALELIPAELTGHQQIVTAARRLGTRPGRMLLDSSHHHAAMRHHNLEDQERRGRPDLVHLFLLTALESPLNHAGGLRVLVHTRHDQLIRVAPETRLVRNYQRFCGLIQQLFEVGQVPPDKPLLTLESGWSLADVLAKEDADRLLVLDEQGPVVRPWEVFQPADAEGNTLAIVGGFPAGRLASPPAEAQRVSFGPRLLSVWTVASELIVNYERHALPRLEKET